MGAMRRGGRGWIGLLLGLGAAGALLWLLADPHVPEDPALPEDASVPEAPHAGPGLTGAGGTVVPPRGLAALWVEVRSGGEPAACHVRIEHLTDDLANVLDPTESHRLPGRVVREGPTDARGRFVARGLAPGRYRVRASGPGVAVRTVELPEGSAREQVRLDLIVGRYAQTLTFRDTGAAAVGWTINLLVGTDWSSLDPWDHGVSLWNARTDAAGRASFPTMAPGRYVVHARAPSGRSITLPALALPTRGDVTLDVSAPRERVSFVVRAADDGRPIPGARVRLVSEDSIITHTSLDVSDADGAVSLPSAILCEGLWIEAPGYAARRMASAGRSFMPDVVYLARTARVQGRVVDSASGAPCAGAIVWLIGDSPWSRASRNTRTDADGRYAFHDAAPGTQQLHVWGGGWYSKSLEGIQGSAKPNQRRIAAGHVHEETLHAVPTVTVQGVLLSSTGVPVAGAQIHRRADTGIEGVQFRQEPASTSTEKDGSFVLEDVVPRAIHHLEAFVDGTLRDTMWFEGRRPSEPITWRLPATRTLELTVRNARTKQPIAGAGVKLEDGLGVSDGTLYTTDDSGRLVLHHLVPEVHLWAVLAPGYQSRLESERLDDPSAKGAAPIRVVIDLEPATTVEGRVIVPPDVGHTSIRLQLRREEGSDEEGGRIEAMPDLHGRFRFDGVWPGEHMLEGEIDAPPAYASAEMPVRAGSTNVVFRIGKDDMEEQAGDPWLRARVQDTRGRLLPRGMAFVARLSPDGGHAKTDISLVNNGITEWSRTDSATSYIAVVAQLGPDGLHPNLAPQFVGPLSEAEDPAPIVLRPGRVVRGRITDPSGAGIAGVLVTARMRWPAAVPAEHAIWIGRCTTDAAGTYELRGMPEGEVILLLSEQPRGFEKVSPRVVSAKEGTVDWVLPTATTAEVRVTDWRGKPLPSTLVRWIPEREDYSSADIIEAQTDRYGRVTFGALPSNEPRVLVIVPPKRRGDCLVYREAGVIAGDRSVQLARGYLLEVTVLDIEDRPVVGATVRMLDDRGGWTGKVGTDARGRMTLTRLPAGIVRLQADPKNGEAGPMLAVDAASGTCVLRIGAP